MQLKLGPSSYFQALSGCSPENLRLQGRGSSKMKHATSISAFLPHKREGLAASMVLLFFLVISSLDPVSTYVTENLYEERSPKKATAERHARVEKQLDLTPLLLEEISTGFGVETKDQDASYATTREQEQDSNENDESNESNEIEESNELMPTVEKFDEAMERACSPDTKNDLFGQLGGSVTGAVGQVDQWMGTLMGAMTKLESDPTALYEYLTGTGSLGAVLKSTYLFTISVIAGILVLIIYLFCCLPKLCSKALRRMCCCFKCCSGGLNICSRVIWIAVLAVLALVGVIFGCLVINYQISGVNGIQQLYCQAYMVAEETLRGTSSLNEKTPESQTREAGEFGGLLPLIDEVTSLALLADGANRDNVLEHSKKAALQALEVAPLAAEMNNAFASLSTSCSALLKSKTLAEGFHKSLWCQSSNESDSRFKIDLNDAEKQMKTSAEKIVEFGPKKYVGRIFEGVALPSLKIEESFPIETVKDLFFKASDALADTEETVSKVLRWLGIGLNVDSGLYLALLLLVILWSAWFFCRGSKASSATPAVLWNLLNLVVVVFLVFGGVLGWVMTIGRQGCSISTNYFLEQDEWDLLTDFAPFIKPLVNECLTKDGQGDLLAGVGVAEVYDQTVGAVKQTIEEFPTSVLPLDPQTSSKAEAFLRAASSFGTFVASDPTLVSENRKEVFPEFLQSGMQAEDADIDGEKLYGLATLEALVAPWKLLALHPEEDADGEFIVNGSNPEEADPKYVKWLDDLKQSKKSEFEAQGVDEKQAETKAETFKNQTRNGIWWLQQKQKLLTVKYPCTVRGREQQECSFEEMFGIDGTQLQSSYMYTTQETAGKNYLNVSACFSNAIAAAIGEITNKVIDKLQDIRESLNCRFLRRNVVQVSLLACESVVSGFYYVAMYRALGGAAAYLVIVTLILLWRGLKDGKTSTGSPSTVTNV